MNFIRGCFYGFTFSAILWAIPLGLCAWYGAGR